MSRKNNFIYAIISLFFTLVPNIQASNSNILIVVDSSNSNIKNALLSPDWLKFKGGGHIGEHFKATAPEVDHSKALPGYTNKGRTGSYTTFFEDEYNTQEKMIELVKEVINSADFKIKGKLISGKPGNKPNDFQKIYVYGKGNDHKEYIFSFHKGFGIETGFPSTLDHFNGLSD